jgi:hypothetical protein
MSLDNQGHAVADREIPHSASCIPHSLLAWAGWRLEMPATWQPLKLTGTPAKGRMIVGDSTCAMFSIHWERLKGSAIPDARAWVTERLKRHGVLPGGSPPGRKHFTACGWAYGVQTEEDKQTTYWYGCSADAQLVLGVTVNGVLPADLRDQVTGQVLTSLRVTPAGADSTWAMYDVSFVAPAGFELARRHLYSGDVALEFRRGRRETLLLRQVYPGDLALGRRSFEGWLATYPFLEHRRLRRVSVTTEPDGAWRRGEKRLGFPLEWVASRRTCALAVHDPRLNRLLIAEHMASAPPDEAVCRAAVERMNRFQREGV